MGFLIAAICLGVMSIVWAIQGDFDAFGGGIVIAVILVGCWFIRKKVKARNPKPNKSTNQCPPSINTTYVFITPNGKKYHHDPSCAGIDKCIRIELQAARSKGYTECGKCQIK